MMLVALLIEFVFGLVFARALVTYVRGRDPLQRDVVLVFAAVAALFAVDMYRRLIGPPPDLLRDLTSVLVFSQPYLTLRLVTRLRPMPRWLPWAALVACLGTAVPLIALPRPVSVAWVQAAIGVYVVTGAVAAVFLAGEARRRTGSPRARLWLASWGMVLMALALLVIAIGIAVPRAAVVTTVAGRGSALAAAFAYLVAFMPPASLRRLWAGEAAYVACRRLLSTAEESGPATWHRYVATVRGLAGADAVAMVALSAEDRLVELAIAGLPETDAPGGGELPPDIGGVDVGAAELGRVLWASQPVAVVPGRGGAVPPLAAWYARRGGARYVRAVAVPLPSGRPGALLLINRYRSLFAEDDGRILADVGGQAAILAERSALRAELSASVAAAHTASRAKSDFLANMSHELRTPLNAIIGFSDLMRAEPLDDEARRVPATWIDNVFGSGQHLLRLINFVLDLAKVEAGRLELNLNDIALPAAVGEVATALRPLLERKHLRLDCPVPPLAVTADPVRLRQILDNLLSNAIKFTPEGGQITVTAVQAGPQVQLSVADTGIGIDLADQQRIFDEFTQTGPEEIRQSGTGLGLALTRRLVQAHGGHIDVASTLGRGARFTVHLPAAAPAPAPTDLASRRGRILVVEDDPNTAALLRTYLETAGYEVHTAPTGETGLAAARQDPPDAILLDVLLPGITGWDVLRELRQDPMLHGVPVFVVTVLDEPATDAAQPTDVFVKPIDRQRLLARLAEHVLTATPSNTSPAVLVIDDDPTTLHAIQATLHQAGAAVTTALDPAEGLRLAGTRSFDLIVADLAITATDGFTLITALHADPATCDTPILVVTTHDLSHTDLARLGSPIVGVLTKDDHLATELRDRVNHLAAPPRPPAAQPPTPAHSRRPGASADADPPGT